MDFFNIKTIKLSHKIKFITVSSVNAHFCFFLFKFLTLTPDLSFFSKGEVSSEDVLAVITILAGLHVFSKFVNQSSQVWIQFALVKSVRPVTPTLCPSL